jgi:TRAP-type mannitol/chloroaromatic compound transport system permease small subunit
MGKDGMNMIVISEVGGKAKRIIGRVSEAALAISGVTIAVIGLVVTYAALRRYVFHNPEPYSYDVSTMLSVFSAALAIPGVQFLRKNIRLDFVAGRLPLKVQKAVLGIGYPLMGLSYAVVLTWQTWKVGWYSLEVGEVAQSIWGEPLWPIKLVIPIGLGLLCLVLVAQLCQGMIALVRGGDTGEW